MGDAVIGAAGRRIVVHDYAGHPFQIELSRELAGRGYLVDHQYCASYVSGHGDMQRHPADSPRLTVTPIRLRRPFERYKPWLRVRQEIEYSLKAYRAIVRAHPDVVVLCNVPLMANVLMAALLLLRRVPYVFWHQDVSSEAVKEALQQRLPSPMGRLIGALAELLERQIARRSRAVVAITEEFVGKYREWRLPKNAYTVISNWAQPDRFSPQPADRTWLGGLPDRPHLLLYAGTLGLKHDPGLLLELARSPHLSDCTVAVVSEGRGREWLEDRLGTVPDGRLVLRDFVPFEQLPGVLASADVLISILEPAASRFSVPSKVLTYLCVGSPVLAVMDPGNAAARMISDSGAGIVLSHSEADRAPAVVRHLLDDPARRERMGAAARALAEQTFDITEIADRFEEVILAATSGVEGPSPVVRKVRLLSGHGRRSGGGGLDGCRPAVPHEPRAQHDDD